MDISTILVVAGLLIVVGYTIVIYNNLVSLKHNVSKNLANIDVLLKQRHEELPKLISTCKQYMQHERETLERVIDARNSVQSAQQQQDVRALGQAETKLRTGLGHLFALAENYPDLKANQSFQRLQQRISALESSIADRRELYNDSVNLNNMRLEQFPDLIIARNLGFKDFDLLEFSDDELKDIDIEQQFLR